MSFYEDFLCPACGNFERTFGPTVSKLIDTGAIAADYSMVSILDSPKNQNYSSRAGAAAFASPMSPSMPSAVSTPRCTPRHPAQRTRHHLPRQREVDRDSPARPASSARSRTASTAANTSPRSPARPRPPHITPLRPSRSTARTTTLRRPTRWSQDQRDRGRCARHRHRCRPPRRRDHPGVSTTSRQTGARHRIRAPCRGQRVVGADRRCDRPVRLDDAHGGEDQNSANPSYVPSCNINPILVVRLGDGHAAGIGAWFSQSAARHRGVHRGARHRCASGGESAVARNGIGSVWRSGPCWVRCSCTG